MLYTEYKIKFSIIFLYILLLSAISAGAQTEIGSCITISTPGNYVLTGNIIAHNATCIVINSSDVTLDGSGFTINGTGNPASIGVEVSNPDASLTGVVVKNLKIKNWGTGILYRNTSEGKVLDNIVSSNEVGIALDNSANNTIYNNLFNNTNNLNFIGPIQINKWNISKTSGSNIVNGTFLGGNFWATPANAGFSQTCGDSDTDGICDSNFTLVSGNIDHLPLTITAPVPATPAPTTPSPTSTPTSPPVIPALPLKIVITSEPESIMSGQTSIITVSVTGSNGEDISNANVTLISGKGGELDRSSGQTNLFGEFTSNFKAYTEGNITVRALVKKEGFEEKSSDVRIDVSPKAIAQTPSQIPVDTRENGIFSWLWAVLIILIIAILSASILYKRKNKNAKKIEEINLCIYCKAQIPSGIEFCPKCGKKQEEIKRFCTNCGAPMPHAPERCPKCGRLPPSGADVKTCKNCGEIIPAIANFCSTCGSGQPE